MEEIRPLKVELSDCRSYGSHQHQSGRSAKVSIGITVLKSPRITTEVSGVIKEKASALHSPDTHSACNRGTVTNNSWPHGIINLETSKMELKEQKNLERLTTSFSGHKTSNTVKLYVNQKPMSTHKNVDGLSTDHCGEEDGGLTFATMHKTNLLDHEIHKISPPEVDNSTTDGLKMKLWEILGGFPSQKEQNVNGNKENVGGNHNRGLLKGRAGKTKHCSDPIETDSDGPNTTARRPETRSMTRKITPNKVVKSLDTALNCENKPFPSITDCKHKAEKNLKDYDNETKLFSFCREENRRMLNPKAYEKNEEQKESGKIIRSSSIKDPNARVNINCNGKENIFSFSEVFGAKKQSSEKSATAQSKRFNKKENVISKMKTTCLPTGSSSKSALQKDEKDKLFPSSAKGLQQFKTSPGLPYPSKNQFMQTNCVSNNSRNSLMNKQSLSSPPSVPKVAVYEAGQSSPSENENGSLENLFKEPKPMLTPQPEKMARSPVTSTADASDDLQSPTFAGNVTPSTPSRLSNEIPDSPFRRSAYTTWNLNNSDNMDKEKPGSCGSESDDMRNVYESQCPESLLEVGQETKEQLSLSPLAKHDSDSSETKELWIKGVRQRSKLVPSVDNSAKSLLKLHKRRRILGLKDAKLSERDETNLQEASCQLIEDSLARALNQLALALRRIRSKIQLHTNKKSCEILAAVADKIKLQLKNADSQIQEDVEKFTGANKTKRKRLESRLDEHRERIRLIHDKFKEEVNHYLLNCRSTLEALEAQNLEMKGTANLQRVQHRKLLLQIEGAMKDQLSAAETTIAAVEKDSKKKFKSLKFALKEWLGEEELSTKS